jgi:hypothetical protein
MSFARWEPEKTLARLCEANDEGCRRATVRHSERMVAMATAMSSPTAEISEIQKRMALVRHDMHKDVREAVKGARSLTDWRSLVRSHPWLSLATVVATGYLIVPKRRTEAPAVVAVSVPTASPKTVVPTHVNLASAPREKSWSLMGAVLGLVAPVVIRAAQNYAAQYVEQWLAPQAGNGDRDRDRFKAPAQPAPRGPRDVRS